jgi:hypothetical protein
MVGQFGFVNGSQVGMGPPPPGTLLGVSTTVVVFEERFPLNANAMTRVSNEIRIAFDISKSPSKVVGG